jgi:hypothetical protein
VIIVAKRLYDLRKPNTDFIELSNKVRAYIKASYIMQKGANLQLFPYINPDEALFSNDDKFYLHIKYDYLLYKTKMEDSHKKTVNDIKYCISLKEDISKIMNAKINVETSREEEIRGI